MKGYTTKTFKDIFTDADTFATEFNSSAFTGSISNIAIVYALLYAKYGNSHIMGKNEDQ